MYHLYLDILRRRWLLLLLGVANAAAVAALVNMTTPPRYESTVRVLTGQTAESSTSDYQGLLADQQLAKTYAELVTTRPVLEAVIQKLQLPTDPDGLARNVKATLIPDTRLLDVTVTGSTPEGVAAVANAFGEQMTLLSPGGAEAAGTVVRQNAQADISTLRSLAQKDELELMQVDQQLAAAEAAGANTTELRQRRAALQDNVAKWHNTLANLYDTLLRTSERSITVVTPAAVPIKSISPGLAQTLALAVPIGLVLAVALALAQDMLDDTIRSPARLPTDEGLPFLGSVPRFKTSRKRMADALVAVRQPRSSASEAYRAVRTALRGVSAAHGPQTLVVTSARPGEGKTTTAANLAVLLAQVGKRVVLIDADLRDPSLHWLFDLAREPGLADELLRDTRELGTSVKDTGVARLRLLCGGSLQANPSELLASARMEELLSALRHDADVVIIDTPPVLAVTDAAVLVRYADSALLVTGAGMTSGEEMARARDILANAGATFAGVVLTKTDETVGRYYGYGRGYGEYALAEPVVVSPAAESVLLRNGALVSAGSDRHAAREPAPVRDPR